MSTVRCTVLTLAMAAVCAAEPLAVADAPLPAWLPEPVALPALPAPIADAAVRVELGRGRTLALGELVRTIDLDGTWRCSGLTTAATRFADDAQLDRGFQAEAFDDRAWDEIAVPLNWYKRYPKAQDAKKPFVLGWYRRALDLGAPGDLDALAGRRAVLHFDVAGYQAELWVNGQPAGSHHGDFTPWEVDVSDLVKPGRNTLALRVRSDQGPKWGAGAAQHTYGSQWSLGNIKGGLWQSCRLRIEPAVRVAEVLVAPRWRERAIALDWRLLNHTGKVRRIDLRAIVQDARAGGARVADQVVAHLELPPGETRGQGVLAVPGIAAWSPAAPQLNHLVLVAEEGGRALGAGCERFGFRSFERRGNRFWLNDRPVYLAGDSLKAHQFGGQGRTPAAEAAFIDGVLGGFKANGFAILRNAHMPITPAVLRRADELGLMIFDEWAWSFTKDLDASEFPRRNPVEVEEWVRRDHNHPSVVMWSCGNEVNYDNDLVRRELDRQVAQVRALDRQGRPVSTFSGAAYGYGSTALDTDVIDLHDYHGLGGGAWSLWNPVAMARTTAFLDRTYGEAWRRDKPFIVWECIGFSWGQVNDPAYQPGDIESYLRWAAKPTSWGAPNGVGFAGTLGLAAALDPTLGTAHGRRTYGTRLADLLRRDPLVQGFAPWFGDHALAEARAWNQPVYATLVGANGIPPRHPLAGDRLEAGLVVVNHGAEDLRGARAELALAGGNGALRPLASLALPDLPPWERAALPVSLDLPAASGDGWWQLRISVRRGDAEVSRLGLPLRTGAQPAPLPAARPVAVLAGGDAAGVRTWLADLAVPAVEVGDAAALAASGCTAAVLPPGRAADQAEGAALRAWVRGGGTLLALEQPAGESPVLGLALRNAANTCVDLAVPGHPLFAGIDQAQLDTSDHPDHGLWVRTAMTPLTVNALAARGPFLGDQGVSGVVAEGSLGKGRLVASQLMAVGQWKRDAVATRYLANLAAYLFATDARPVAGLRPWQEAGGGLAVEPARCRPLDLRSAANRDFRDEVANDRQGGWTDQGGNDFRMMPLGEQTLHGVPFTIIDPAANQRRACLALRSRSQPWLPEGSGAIPVGAPVARLFALHTAAWVGEIGQVGLIYRVRYADGTSLDVPVRSGFEIGDWWNPSDLVNARLGLTATNDQLRDVGLFLMTWENPRPDQPVASIEAVSTGTILPLVVALTVETGSGQALRFAPDGAWRPTTDRPGNAKEGAVAKPEVEPVAETAPGGQAAVRLRFPSPVLETAVPTRPAAVPVAIAMMPSGERGRLGDGTWRYLTLWIKAEDKGSLDLSLPRQDWKDSAKAEIACDPARGWQKVRLSLAADLQLGRGRAWEAKDLRGELLLYHGRTARPDAAAPAPLSVLVADARLE